MKIHLLIIAFSVATSAAAQQGYVRLKNDSIVKGYMRYYRDANSGEAGWEVWKTKNDKTPRRVSIANIHEYAYKKDTMRVFHDLKPFYDEDMYFERVELKALSRGKVNIYVISLNDRAYASLPVTGGIAAVAIRIPVEGSKKVQGRSFVYLLENPETGFVSGVPSRKEELIETLRDFFPERYITRYEEEIKEINYKSLREMVTFYNSR